MTINDWNELRWRTIAKREGISLSQAKEEYPPVEEMPDWAEEANPEEISRGWGAHWVYKGE